MKRRYKAGDWFRVPLGEERDAVGIITRSCQSRLFGYFFPVEAGEPVAPARLKALRAQDAFAALLFGGAGLEDARWTLVATSLPFDPAAWPFPQFASRGAFGRTWTAVTYDGATMRASDREPMAEQAAVQLPDARFATPEELEEALRHALHGATARKPFAVCEIRAPIEVDRLRLLEGGGRVQFSEALGERDLQTLAVFIAAHSHVELRVHGMPSFDVRLLAGFRALRGLVLDVPALEHIEALEPLQSLESFELTALREFAPLDVLGTLPALRSVVLRGSHADVRALAALKRLTALALVDTPSADFGAFQSQATLVTLLLSHVRMPLDSIGALRALERLQLRNMQLKRLPDFSANVRLRALELRNITQLRDLTPLAHAPALCDLRIEGMPQLNVPDFAPLAACAGLRSLSAEIGSKSKTREVYRALRLGKTAP